MENKRGFIIRNGVKIGAVGDKNFSTLHIGCITPYLGTKDNVPRGYLLADGASYKTTDYPELFDIIGYTYGGSDGTFNVPNLCDGRFLEGSDTSGEYVEAGLPNITGYLDMDVGGAQNVEGAFYKGTTFNALYGGNPTTVTDVAFDASKSNPIYGNADTVQPKSLRVLYIIKAFHTNEGVDSGVSDDVVEYVDNKVATKKDAVKLLNNATDSTKWLKLKLGSSATCQPIIVSDQYGGKVEITGMTNDGTYKSAKLVRYSYGDWTTHSATDYTLYNGVDPNYKIQKFYYYPTDGYYYLEIRQWATIKVEGNSAAELVTSLPAEESEMTLIPESNWGRIDDTSTKTSSTWSSSKIAQQINSATTIKYDNVINANATKETDWSLAQGESHFYGKLLQLDGHLGSKSSTFSFLLFVKANYDNPTTVYVTQLAGMDDDRTNITHAIYFELGVSSNGNLTIKNKSAVAASYRFI